MATTAPYGSWRSPISAARLVEKSVGLSDLQCDGADLWWNEARPQEAGRQVLVRRGSAGEREDVLPAGFSARTLVHEYGGRSYVVRGGSAWFANHEDQAMYRVVPGQPPTMVHGAEGSRFADFDISPDGSWLVAVRERHSSGDVVNDIVVLPPSGGEPQVVAEGHDFFSAPRFSPDGRRLCWLAWDHPNMPWDGTTLFAAEFRGPDGAAPTVVAGGRDESVSQPRWAPDGALWWVSDLSGWWNLYRDGDRIVAEAAEFTGPDWVFGQRTYAFLPDGRLVAAWSHSGLARLGIVEDGVVWPVDLPFSAFGSVCAFGDAVACIAGAPDREPEVVVIHPEQGRFDTIARSRDLEVDREDISLPEPIEFPTAGGTTAHALYYAPKNSEFSGPSGERPPLLVKIHGGPTSAASPTLDLRTQFWTTRGFAVVDVNYRGSTGYGREYRNALRGQWGVADLDDCVHAALFLAERGDVDRDRMVIRGGSAGGYTTLCALVFRDVFAAGASYYGVADAEALAADTHKFESRYLDSLIGPYPEARDVYRDRSPIHSADRLSCPLILFQGLEDRVVPPEQSEAMAEALRKKGIPFAYVAFEGEQHGFRKAETVVRATEAELWFYGRILGFEPADVIEPVELENAPAG